jgi:hypothetical protein
MSRFKVGYGRYYGKYSFYISLEFETLPLTRLGDLLETNLPVIDSAFTRKVFTHYKPE